jgi:thioredoxin-related protein
MYMIPGLWGAPLKSISAFLPPQASQDFDLYSPNGNVSQVTSSDNGKPHKYADLFDKPKGFNPFFDYAEGLAYARKVHKPVMIDFTGHACVNCRKMEANVWTDKQVYQCINNDYILIQLYVDDKTDLSPAEQTITLEGKHIQTIGNKWSYLETSKFQANSQPFYVLLNPYTEQPLVAPQGANFDPVDFLKYLDSGLSAYH